MGDIRRKYIKKSKTLLSMQRKKEEWVLQYCKERLTPNFYTLLRANLRNTMKQTGKTLTPRDPRGRRYLDDELAIFLEMSKKSPVCYRSMPGIKPVKKTVDRLLHQLDMKPGNNLRIQEALKARVASMPDEQRDVVLCMDEMSVKIMLEYDVRHDCVRGLVDMGNGERRPYPADNALVGMIRCIYGNWKQPVNFVFTNKSMKAVDFSGFIVSTIEWLQPTKTRIRALIFDGLNKNWASVEMLGATAQEPRFFVNGQKVNVIMDIPHAMKSVRNAALKYKLRLRDGTIIDFTYVVEFVEMDLTMKYRLAPRVTRIHIEPNNFQKQNVALATQLLSAHVAAGMCAYIRMGALSEEAMPTVDFIAFMNDRFDSFNGTKPPTADDLAMDPPPYKTAVTPETKHVELWKAFLEEMEGWHFEGSRNLGFHKRWCMTIRSLLELWDDFQQAGRTYFPVGHCNQDCEENAFSRIRLLGGHRHNPSCKEFCPAFSALLLTCLTATIKGKNCKDDGCLNLLNLEALLRKDEMAAATAAATAAAEAAAAAAADVDAEAQAVDEPQAAAVDAVADEEPLFDVQNLLPADFQQPEDEDDEDDEDDDEPVAASYLTPHANANPFATDMEVALGSMGLPVLLAPVLEDFLRKERCDACRSILMGPYDLQPHMALALLQHNILNSAGNRQILPREIPLKAMKAIADLGEQQFPRLVLKDKVMETFMKLVLDLPEVARLQLCPQHGEDRGRLVSKMSSRVLSHYITAVNENFIATKKQLQQARRNSKLQRVQNK